MSYVWFLLLLATKSTLSWPCPATCRCTGTKVECDGAELGDVPARLPPHTTELSLRNNSISALTSRHLRLLPNLEKLDLSNNAIRVIDTNAALTLASLHRLVIAGNPLHCSCALTPLLDLLEYDSGSFCLSPRHFRGRAVHKTIRDVCGSRTVREAVGSGSASGSGEPDSESFQLVLLRANCSEWMLNSSYVRALRRHLNEVLDKVTKSYQLTIAETKCGRQNVTIRIVLSRKDNQQQKGSTIVPAIASELQSSPNLNISGISEVFSFELICETDCIPGTVSPTVTSPDEDDTTFPSPYMIAIITVCSVVALTFTVIIIVVVSVKVCSGSKAQGSQKAAKSFWDRTRLYEEVDDPSKRVPKPQKKKSKGSPRQNGGSTEMWSWPSAGTTTTVL